MSAQFSRQSKQESLRFLKGVLFISMLLSSVSCGGARNETENQNSINMPRSLKTSPNFTSRAAATKFEQNLSAGFPLPEIDDAVTSRILKDYGAVFVARGAVVTAPKIIFESEEDCAAWQANDPKRQENFGGINIELQEAAMRELLAARAEANARNFNFTARGTLAARRNYGDTVKIWLTRVGPGLIYWTQRGRLSEGEAARIRTLEPSLQVKEILQLESQKMFFSKDFSKSILYSATAPGASQHLSMLAVDLNEYANPAVREVLARHGWFQTIVSDLPHFTFLGVAESELPALGLKKTVKDNRAYWTPE